MARRYQKIQALLPEIKKMSDDGMTPREVEEAALLAIPKL